MEIHDLDGKSTSFSTDDLFITDDGEVTTKTSFPAVAQAVLETYAGLSLAGKSQSVKNALDGMNRSFMDDIPTVVEADGETKSVDKTVYSAAATQALADRLEQKISEASDAIPSAYAGSQSAGGAADVAEAILFGDADTSDGTAFGADVANFTRLHEGLCLYLRNRGSVASSASGFTLNVNGSGAFPVYLSTGSIENGQSAVDRATTEFKPMQTRFFLFRQGGWEMYIGDGQIPSNGDLGHGYYRVFRLSGTNPPQYGLTSSLSGYTPTVNYTPTVGGHITILANTAIASGGLLKIGSEDAKPMYFRGAAIEEGVIQGRDTATFSYDGSRYNLVSVDRWQIDTQVLSEQLWAHVDNEQEDLGDLRNDVEGLSEQVEGLSARGVYYGDCFTKANYGTKDVTCEGFPGLVEGVCIRVKFEYAQGSGSSTALKVNDTEAKSIRAYGNTNPEPNMWRAGEVVDFVFAESENVWRMVDGGIASSDNYGMTMLSSAVNSESMRLAATPYAVKRAYDLANTANQAAAALAEQVEGLSSGQASGTAGGVYYGTCASASNATVKEVTCENFPGLEPGVSIRVKFDNTHSSVSSPSLRVNGTASKDVRSRIGAGTSQYMWREGEVLDFVYAENVWLMVDGGLATTTYYGMTKLSSAVDSTSEYLAASSLAVKKAYDLANQAAALASRLDELEARVAALEG